MARIAAPMERQPADRRRSRDARNDQGPEATPHGDALAEQVLENVDIVPREGELKKIASLSRTRQDKVLDIRRQIAAGTYKVGARLEGAMDRVLEALTR
jgi:anti-sigma28 factor (negative regulator of flagellin synthesis)